MISANLGLLRATVWYSDKQNVSFRYEQSGASAWIPMSGRRTASFPCPREPSESSPFFDLTAPRGMLARLNYWSLACKAGPIA